MSPITSMVSFSSSFLISSRSFSNKTRTCESESRSIQIPLRSISIRNQVISFISSKVGHSPLLCSSLRSAIWARYISAQLMTSAAAYSKTISKGIRSKPTPCANISSISSDFFLVTSRRSAVALRLLLCCMPRAKIYSPIIVQCSFSGSTKSISTSQVTSNFVLWHTTKSALSKSFWKGSRLSG